MVISSASFSSPNIQSRNVTQDNDTQAQQNTYPLTIIGTVFAALSLCLAFITTLIAIINFRARVRDRTGAHGRGVIGESRNPINDEAGREARDALAQPCQLERMDDASGVLLETLPPAVAQADPPLSSMPAKRPSHSRGNIKSPDPDSGDLGHDVPSSRI
ncbi:uncharacterized protein F4807DRAFT_459462 [Annulohypoxylon truncatum]|uniref:uncharacterized protein n=1 Tax=Annulohypoxylon truncatum TaxID=327061 RepID=UPI0020072877|nr:uncharacterized protein F4807DRAFT_459462 [Annulohypoxylon truncatum]KAI1210621.1 hypothetical protein F4807DRAFT_459462 [Annulohypoxylon truncatum]